MAKNTSLEKKKLLTSKLNKDLKKRFERVHLECCTVCSRDMDTDGNIEEEVRSL